MRIVITGAAGRIGNEIVAEFSGSHELSLVDRKSVTGRNSFVIDLARCHSEAHWWHRITCPGSRGRRWQEAFAGTGIVIHLAEDPNNQASWQNVLKNNFCSTWNVLEVAVKHGARRIIYASSIWATKMQELKLAPACYRPDGPKIGSDAEPRPMTPYGIGKAWAELTGRSLVDEGKLDSFVAIRLGWFTDDPQNNDEYRRIGICAQDLRSLFRRCVAAEFRGFHVVYGVSAQKTAPFDLSYTRRLLDWDPRHRPA